MRIVADANIPYLHDAFGPLGEVVTLPAKELGRAAVLDADLLLVRSTIRVNAALLEGSRVRFVATATIGIDHLDTAWLDGAGIRWTSAPGSNADSVVQWLAAALARVPDVAGRQLGIVGVGNVGGRVERLFRALDVKPPLLCDPPRARREGAAGFVTLDEILERCDLVTLHVPLTRSGADATFHLVDARRLRPDAVLVNACRGEVLDTASALAVANPLVLDVFEGEPTPDPRLVARALVATPHIAGHSLDGKANGTKMIYDAACAFLGVAPTWTPRAVVAAAAGRDRHRSPRRRRGRRARSGRRRLRSDGRRRGAARAGRRGRRRLGLPQVPREVSRAPRARRAGRALRAAAARRHPHAQRLRRTGGAALASAGNR